MLHVFYGTDTNTVADKTNAFVGRFRVQEPDILVTTFEGEVVDTAHIEELVEARGLFVQKQVVVLKSALEKAESRELVFAHLPQFVRSENIFVLSEGGLHVAHKRILAECAHTIEEYARPSQGKPMFDQHGLVSALKARNKRGLWEGYARARRGKETPEAICGLLHWGVRDMLQQSDRYSSVYTRDQLCALSRSLIEVYHESHRGVSSLDEALERWALTL